MAPPRVGAQDLQPYRAAVHVHSTFSTGKLTVDELAKKAKENGLDILILTDHARISMAWGLWPLANLLRVQEDRPSVFQIGPRKYLAAVAKANRTHPKVLLIPGLEVTAHYHFSGSPFQDDLKAHNWRRHMHIIGLKKASDILALPVAGGPTVNLLMKRGMAEQLKTFWPYIKPGFYLLLTLVGVLSAFQRRTLEGARRPVRRVVGFLAFLVFLPLGVNELPFLKSPSDPYRGDPGIRPYQHLINTAVKAGGVVLWAHQGSLLQTQKVGPITLVTPPYPEVLLLSRGYAAFDAIYEDAFVASKPGKQWDVALVDYLKRKRRAPVWAYGGVDFHHPAELRNRKKLSDIQTVFFLKKKTEAEVFSALKEGRMYVVRGYGPSRLRLDEFSANTKGGNDAKNRKRMAISGGTLRSTAPPEIRFQISTGDESQKELTVELIRNGEVIQMFQGKTPLKIEYTDPNFPALGKVYYRLDAKVSRSEHLLTNPIFVSLP
jgi:hypothetical protein